MSKPGLLSKPSVQQRVGYICVLSLAISLMKFAVTHLADTSNNYTVTTLKHSSQPPAITPCYVSCSPVSAAQQRSSLGLRCRYIRDANRASKGWNEHHVLQYEPCWCTVGAALPPGKRWQSGYSTAFVSYHCPDRILFTQNVLGIALIIRVQDLRK